METAIQTCYKHPDQPAGVICQRCDRPICGRCMHQASVGFHCPECTKQGKQKVYQGIGSLRARPILTQVLIGINLAVFLVGMAIDGKGAFGGETGRLQLDFGLIAKAFDGHGFIGVGEGQWYRLVTSGFLHYGILHILFNMYALWVLGNAVENLAGRLRFAIIYGTALLAGALGALVLSPGSLTAGASGAIFGLAGALFVAHRAQGVPFSQSPILPFLVINLVFTFGLNGISIGGHLGGLAGGAAVGWILLDYGRRPGLDKRLPLAAAGALALLCVVGAVVFANGWTPT